MRGSHEIPGKCSVSVGQLVSLARRHIFSVGLILLITVGLAFGLKHMRPTYTETATVVVETAGFKTVQPLSVDSDFLRNSSLINTCELLVMYLDGPQGEAQLRRAGVAKDFTVSIVNGYNADQPSYAFPDLLVSATGADLVATNQEFKRSVQVIDADLAKFQSGDQFPAEDRIQTYIVSDSGPLSQRGSSIRVYAGLAFLALVAIFMVSSLLDARPLRGRRGSRRLAAQ
jgi:hypothetical protein